MNWYKKASQITPDPNLIKWMVQKAKPYIQALMINKTIRDIKIEIKELSNFNYINDISIKRDIKALQDRLKIYQSMPKAKFPSVQENPSGEITIDVPPSIIPKDIQKLMEKHKKQYMFMILRQKLKDAGIYEEDFGENIIAIKINLAEAMKAKDPYEYMIELLSHELVHNLQHLMSTKDYGYGRPSKSISNPNYTYEGVSKSKNTSRYDYHSLIDDEFYPRLSEKILKINYSKQKNPNLDMIWFKNFIEKDEWLDALKKGSVEKYHKAVNELLKEFQK